MLDRDAEPDHEGRHHRRRGDRGSGQRRRYRHSAARAGGRQSRSRHQAALTERTMFRKHRPSEVQSPPPVPRHGDMKAHVPSICHEPPGSGTAWYPPLMIGAGALAETITHRRYVELALNLLRRLAPDDYSRYMAEFYADGLARFGETWRYADIVTLLLG